MARDKSKLGNIGNYRTLPLLEGYVATYYEKKIDDDELTYVDPAGIQFRYADGTSDSYVKRGFDEEFAQYLARYQSVEGAYRIFTTEMNIKFKPGDIIYIGHERKTIHKVLPLMNQYDMLRSYNYDPALYRQMSPKLIYLK